METIKYKQHTITIQQDTDPSSPREDENLGTLVCWHGRYNLGDAQPDVSPDDYRRQLFVEHGTEAEHRSIVVNSLKSMDLEQAKYILNRYDSYADIIDAEELDTPVDGFPSELVVLPVYLYDHSGLSISTGSFSCDWDSGQIGFVYISRHKIQSACLADKPDTKIKEYLSNEINAYDQFLRGDVHGYTITDCLGDEIDSCWGFYGQDYCLLEAKSVVDQEHKKAA